jgi:hypothetical protein
MKACYFIQSHKNPEQIYRLVRTIKKSSPTSQVLVGHDFTSCHLDMTPLADLSEVDLLRGDIFSRRGEFSLLQPYLNAINWLFEHNSNFDWLIYLSGQDYPTQPLSQVEAFLSQTKYDGFMQYWSVGYKSRICNLDDIKRYFFQYYSLPEWTKLPVKVMAKIPLQFSPIQFYGSYGSLIGIRAKNHPFNENFICYRGSQWQILSRKCVNFLKEYIDEHPQLVDFYQKTIVPDESFVQTIILNNNFFNICKDDKRYSDFSETRHGHPRVLTSKDYSTITSGKYFFARKLDINQDPKLFDLLDKKVLEYSCANQL